MLDQQLKKHFEFEFGPRLRRLKQSNRWSEAAAVALLLLSIDDAVVDTAVARVDIDAFGRLGMRSDNETSVVACQDKQRRDESTSEQQCNARQARKQDCKTHAIMSSHPIDHNSKGRNTCNI